MSKSSLSVFDQAFIEEGVGYVVGVDEAGRGAFAGPVTAAAVAVPVASYEDEAFANPLFRDSKRLNPVEREEAFSLIQALSQRGALAYSVQSENVACIERLNILGATRKAMGACLSELQQKAIPIEPDGLALFDSHEEFLQGPPNEPNTGRGVILVDGPHLKGLEWPHQGIIKGDGHSLAIAMASIIAKVTRDDLMRGLHQRFPNYGFASNKGYGTAQHYVQIRLHGPCDAHRSRFLRKLHLSIEQTKAVPPLTPSINRNPLFHAITLFTKVL